jgi:hypothetical protein
LINQRKYAFIRDERSCAAVTKKQKQEQRQMIEPRYYMCRMRRIRISIKHEICPRISTMTHGSVHNTTIISVVVHSLDSKGMAGDGMPDPVRHGAFRNGYIIGEFLHFTLRLFQAYFTVPKGVSPTQLAAQDMSISLNGPEQSNRLMQGRTPKSDIVPRGCRERDEDRGTASG